MLSIKQWIKSTEKCLLPSHGSCKTYWQLFFVTITLDKFTDTVGSFSVTIEAENIIHTKSYATSHLSLYFLIVYNEVIMMC